MQIEGEEGEREGAHPARNDQHHLCVRGQGCGCPRLGGAAARAAHSWGRASWRCEAGARLVMRAADHRSRDARRAAVGEGDANGEHREECGRQSAREQRERRADHQARADADQHSDRADERARLDRARVRRILRGAACAQAGARDAVCHPASKRSAEHPTERRTRAERGRGTANGVRGGTVSPTPASDYGCGAARAARLLASEGAKGQGEGYGAKGGASNTSAGLRTGQAQSRSSGQTSRCP